MSAAFSLAPGLTNLELIDELTTRLPAGLAAVNCDGADFEPGQWAGIYVLQQCVELARALTVRPPDARPATAASPYEQGGGEEGGAEAMVALLGTIRDISNATAGRPGGRDYAAMCDAIDAAVLADLGGLPGHRHGFVLALAHLLCVNADGACVDSAAWDPLTAIAAEGAGSGGAAGAARAGVTPSKTHRTARANSAALRYAIGSAKVQDGP